MIEFITIPARAFRMGTPARELSALARVYGGTRESYREESEQHQVQLPAYAISRTPVTTALYAFYLAQSGAPAPAAWHGQLPPGREQHPVVDLSWHEAQAFCGWASASWSELLAVDGSKLARVRLPSEAEWEHAARGTDGRRFPWGEQWEQACANTREATIGSTTAVDHYPQGASPYGVLDLAGNVWEWTSSLDRNYPYRADDGREDRVAAGRRILRGGCYANPHGYARCACRFRLAPEVRNPFLGFRLAASIRS